MIHERLPDDVVRLILAFVPVQTLVCTNKRFYELYHPTLRKRIPLFIAYVRDTVKRDNEFVFSYIVRENIEEWLKNREYRYKNMVFNNFIYFLHHFCLEQDSEQCRQVLLAYFANLDLKKNLHKKNIVKYINTNQYK